ncbi:squalene synthase HpnC [Streptosporangium sandarakinum]|uniref:squalene synthase HpnC n=2 Tax=Streptosporangium sandarakinum TaxID=1260955 RepID=UPI00371D5670
MGRKPMFALHDEGHPLFMHSGEDDAAGITPKAHGENFPVAALVLPRDIRRHLLSVYGFARFVDDVGDEGRVRDPLRMLDDVDADLDLLYTGRLPRLPAVRALTPVVETRAVPAEPFHRLVEANRRDQTVGRYGTFKDLLAYCELSANPVGHIVLHVFGLATAGRMALSDRVCTALQIVEHCQDVGEDHARGRVYLPEEDLRRFGCGERDLAGETTPARLRDVVALQTTRAERLLDEGEPLVSSMGGVARVAVAGYVAGGRATVAALRRAGHDVVGRAVRPHRVRLLSTWLGVLARGTRGGNGRGRL